MWVVCSMLLQDRCPEVVHGSFSAEYEHLNCQLVQYPARCCKGMDCNQPPCSSEAPWLDKFRGFSWIWTSKLLLSHFDDKFDLCLLRVLFYQWVFLNLNLLSTHFDDKRGDLCLLWVPIPQVPFASEDSKATGSKRQARTSSQKGRVEWLANPCVTVAKKVPQQFGHSWGSYSSRS